MKPSENYKKSLRTFHSRHKYPIFRPQIDNSRKMMIVMRPISLLFALLLFSLNVQGQEEMPVLITEMSKGLKVADGAQAKWSKVKMLGVISTGGRLKLGGQTQVTLYCNGDFKTLEGKGEYNLNEIFQAGKQTELTEWQKQFYDFLLATNSNGKTFGKKTALLTRAYGHSSEWQTLEYLCIQPEEIEDLYLDPL